MFGVIVDRGCQLEFWLCLDQGADCVLLVGADLENEVSTGFEQKYGVLDQPCDHSQAVGTAIKGRWRLVLTDSSLEPRDLVGCDVGRIGDDRVEGLLTADWLEDVAESKIDAVRDFVPSGVELGNFECLPADVDGHEPHLGISVSRGDRQTARAGPHIDGVGAMG